MVINVTNNENLGMNTLVYGHLGQTADASGRVSAKLKGWMDYTGGDQVKVAFLRKHFFDPETTNAIR